MNFSTYFYLLYLGILISVSGCTNPSKDSEVDQKPNLFIFLADDLSKSDLGCTGNQFVKTPNIGSFANNSINFSKMYTPTAMCAPSRSTLYTGLYPHSNGCHMNHGQTFEHIKSLPIYLKDLGYQVALVEKAHIKPASVYPFDYLTKDQLNDYLDQNDGPFCIIYASNEPHGPHPKENLNLDSVIIPPKWSDTPSTRKRLAVYYKDIAVLDEEFSAFLNAIKLNCLDKNAVTVFTSDHGSGFFAKWSCYESGLRVPFFLQSNGLQFQAEKVDALVSFTDVLPTFVELAGGKLNEKLDGKSFLPLLKEQTNAIHQYVYGTHTTRGIYSGKAYPIRSITDGEFKYILNLNSEEKFQNILTNGWNFGDSTEASSTWKEWMKQSASNPWVRFYQHRQKKKCTILNRILMN